MNSSKITKISVVIPVYGCCSCLYELYQRLQITLDSINVDYEIILVNDSSPDRSWEIINKISQRDTKVKGINLSRNFGQHYAITAGIDYATGNWLVVMDCDLQDQPEEIIKLYNKALEGYEVVFGRRYFRQNSFFKKMSSKIFYKVLDYLTESKTDNTVANFSIVSSSVMNNYRKLREQYRSFPLFIRWLGFKTAYVNIEHAERAEGKSSYTFNKLLNLAINSIVAQSNKPLRISIKFGFAVSTLSLLYAIYLIVRFLFLSQPVSGWTSMMVSIYFIGGLLFANMGILGLYIGKVFNEVKGRPLYIISETLNINSIQQERSEVTNAESYVYQRNN